MTPLFKKALKLFQKVENRKSWVKPCDYDERGIPSEELYNIIECVNKNEVGVFDIELVRNDIQELSKDFVDMYTNLDENTVEERMRLPNKAIWLEYPAIHNTYSFFEYGKNKEFQGVESPYFGDVTMIGEGVPMAVLMIDDGTFKDTHKIDKIYIFNDSHLMTPDRKSKTYIDDFTSSAIWLLNTPRASEKETMLTSRLKRRNVAPKWANMYKEHHKVHLCVDGVRVDKMYNEPGNPTSGIMPYHLVRGHLHSYWTRKGLIKKWVEPFWRGNPEVGLVTKDYEVTK